MPEIDVVNVRKRFGDVIALDGVSLSVKDGEYVTIVGPSGCGKTTLFKIIAGLLLPDEGEVLIDGRPVTDLPPEDRGIGYVFQDILLFPHMDVWSNITYSPWVKGLEPEEVERIGREIADALSLKFQYDAFPHELSRGLQQKIALARALASGAKILLLDEPFATLDARVSYKLRYEIRKIAKDLKLTVLHVTHDQDEALSVGDRVVVMRKGRIVQVGTPEELYFAPSHPFVAKFIGGECNFLEGKVASLSENTVQVDVGGIVFEALRRGDFAVGERVVLAIKPEHLSLESGLNGLRGEVEDVSYLGPLYRYEVRTPVGVLVIKEPAIKTPVRVGEEIELSVHPSNILIFPYPKEGLERAIAIE